VTDYKGEIYEQLEYTPYRELWVEHLKTMIEETPFRFTGKERDSETGLYYYGARYLNPQTSMWLSADPAMGEYIPQAPINDEAKKHNENLLGMGGVFNYVNLHVYHYAGNNPVKLKDPDGEKIVISGTRKERNEILNKINSISNDQYKLKKVDGAYTLVTTGKINQNGSRESSDILNVAINDPNFIIIFGSDGRVGGGDGYLGGIDVPDELTHNSNFDVSLDIYSGNTSLVFNQKYYFEVMVRQREY
jgi:RHS repeat-associated protein